MTAALRPRRRLLLALLPTLALLSLLPLQWRESGRVSGHRVGFDLEQEAGAGLVISGLVEGQPAIQSGLRSGDRLLALERPG